MPYPPSALHPLPVVRYAPSRRFPGASHAVVRSRERACLPRYVRWAVPLLLAGLAAMASLLHRVAPIVVVAPSLPTAVITRSGPALQHETRWDTRLSAVPRPGQYVRFFRMRATAYTPINTQMEGGRYTSTRRDGRAVHGVAVDPGLIPLGSRLWIPGYGHAVADDIGGAIKGHHVDIRVQVYGHMSRWGVRRVRVYVLQDPKS